MRKTTDRRAPAVALLLVLLPALAPAAEARVCRADTVPAASLMVPRVEVDLARCDDPARPRTAVTVTNVDAPTAVAHVTLWTDWGIPVLTFDLLLTGFDQVDFELEALVCDGIVPTTGPGTSPVGSMSDPIPALAVCDDVLPYETPISSTLLAYLQAALTGEELTFFPGECAGSARGDGIARASITVDLVDDCSLLYPSDDEYFDTARRDNVLVGAGSIGDGVSRRSLPVVHLESRELLDFTERSFYARLGGGGGGGGGGDDIDLGAREPLPSRLALVYQSIDDEPLLRIWREVGRGGEPVQCGTEPPGFPATVEDLVIFDFEENPVVIPVAAGSEMIDVDLATLSGAPDRGWVFVDGGHDSLSDLFTTDQAQTWATIEGGVTATDAVTASPVVLETLCPELLMRRAPVATTGADEEVAR